MLRISISKDGQSATAYFEDNLSKEGGEDYYLTKDIVAIWRGSMADFLGLNGKKVTKETFSAMVNKTHPVTGEPLYVRKSENARAGYDFCINATKSVSLMYALTKDEEILKAHQRAYSAMISAIQADAQTQANVGNDRYYQHTANFMYAAFDHFTARPYQAKNILGETVIHQDPSLHTHLYVPAVTWNPATGRFQALEVGNIWKLSPWYEAVYHSHMTSYLEEEGYQITPNSERYEITGVSRELIERFSGRTAEIEQRAKELGITDKAILSELGSKTRLSKKYAIAENKLDEHWLSRITKSELDQLNGIKGRYGSSSKNITAKEAIDQALQHHLERNSAAYEKRILEYALRLSYGSLLPKDVIAELQSRENILRMEENTLSVISTKELALEEDQLISKVVDGKGRFSALNLDYKPRADFLNEQQRNAIQALLTSKDQFTILRGSAGVGKTTLLLEVKNGIEKGGKSLFAVAPSAQASRGVLREKGFEADTLAALLHSEKLQEQLVSKVLLVDEAGMVGMQDMNKIVQLATEKNIKVILSGDVKQHGPPAQYGDALRILQDRAKLETATVQKIVRQEKEPLRQAIQKFATGRTAQGYNDLDRLGAIKEIPDHVERYETLAKDYAASLKQERTALAISPTHVEGEILTKAIRQELHRKGQTKGVERAFETLHNLHFTEAQKLDLKNYHENNIIRFTANRAGGFKSGSHHKIVRSERDGEILIRDLSSQVTRRLNLAQREHYQIYKPTKTEVRSGDLIRLSSNLQTIEKTRLHNGKTFKIDGFTKRGDLKLSNGKTLSKDAKHFRQGYVETSMGAQGKDAKDVFIAMSKESFGAINEQTIYVSSSRAVQSCRIYTPDKKALKRAVQKSGERLTAKDVEREHQRRLLERKQHAHYQQLIEQQRDHGRIQHRKKPGTTRGISSPSQSGPAR